MNEKYKLASDVIGPRIQAFLSLYGIIASKWQADLEAAINEILEADRTTRPFAPDPRLVEIQENERNYYQSVYQYRYLEMRAGTMCRAEYENALLGAGQQLKDMHNARDALLRSIAASPDVTAPSPDPRIAQLAELQRLAGAYMGELAACPEGLLDALVALATDPIIDPSSPTPQADPREVSEARRKEIQALAAVEADFDRLGHAVDALGRLPTP